jgi:hypothetical protein
MAGSQLSSFTLDTLSIGQLSDLALKLNRNKSDLVREAIDLLYAKVNGLTPATDADQDTTARVDLEDLRR